MTITVLLMTILTGQNHTVVAEYDNAQACEVSSTSTPESPFGFRCQGCL